jgi:hypothetical protein
VREQASAGAAVTVVGVLVMLFLLVSELASYTQVVTQGAACLDPPPPPTRLTLLWLHVANRACAVRHDLCGHDARKDHVDPLRPRIPPASVQGYNPT